MQICAVITNIILTFGITLHHSKGHQCAWTDVNLPLCFPSKIGSYGVRKSVLQVRGLVYSCVISAHSISFVCRPLSKSEGYGVDCGSVHLSHFCVSNVSKTIVYVNIKLLVDRFPWKEVHFNRAIIFHFLILELLPFVIFYSWIMCCQYLNNYTRCQHKTL